MGPRVDRWRSARLFGAAALLAACDPSGARLVVDLRTDLVAEREFTDARLRVYDATGYARREPPLRERSVRASAATDYVQGARLGEESGLSPGDYVIECELTSAHHGGRVVAGRVVRVAIANDWSATVVVSRVCSGTPVRLEGCEGPACASDRDCPAPIAECAVSRCLDGSCLEAGRADALRRGLLVQPGRGLPRRAHGARRRAPRRCRRGRRR